MTLAHFCPSSEQLKNVNYTDGIYFWDHRKKMSASLTLLGLRWNDRPMADIEPEYHMLGSALRRLRRERGLSQERVAVECNMSRSALANIEAGQQRVAFHQFLALARALNVPPGDLLPQESPHGHPVDEHLLSLGVPELAARAVAKIVGEVTNDGSSTDDNTARTSRTTPA